MSPRADVVLFDLDGTLIDSAPDLAATVNHMRLMRGLPEVAYPRLRAHVGSGARGMLLEAFDKRPTDADYESLRQEFMNLYAERLLDTTRVFAAMEPVLHTLDAQRVRWGIVTNKNARMAQRIAQGLGQDDPAQGAPIAQTQGIRGLVLLARDRLQATAHCLGQVSRGEKDECDLSAQELVDAYAPGQEQRQHHRGDKKK